MIGDGVGPRLGGGACPDELSYRQIGWQKPPPHCCPTCTPPGHASNCANALADMANVAKNVNSVERVMVSPISKLRNRRARENG
jgi:hypothetical protein